MFPVINTSIINEAVHPINVPYIAVSTAIPLNSNQAQLSKELYHILFIPGPASLLKSVTILSILSLKFNACSLVRARYPAYVNEIL